MRHKQYTTKSSIQIYQKKKKSSIQTKLRQPNLGHLLQENSQYNIT